MMDLAASSPMGMEFVGRDQLFNIFVGPFVTAIGHTTGKVKEISASAITVLRVAFEAVATTLIPWLQNDYAEIFNNEKEQIEKIRSEYGHYYQETFDALHHDDVLVAAFLYKPELFMTNALVKRAPKAVAQTLSVLSGGLLDKALDNVLNSKEEKSSKSKKFSKPSGGGTTDMWYESLIREKSKEKKNDDVADDDDLLVKLVNNEKVKKIVANSDQTKKLTKVGHQIVDGTLNTLEQHANSIMSVKSAEELQKKMGKQIPELDKLSKIPEQERQKAEQQLLQSVKKSAKEFYTKQLSLQINRAIESGLQQDHPFIKTHEATLTKIKNM
jgi:hypothetical protein